MSSTDYKYLYAKYKNKYLKLKKQIGGSRVFYQPCEINRLTTGLFINDEVAIKLNLFDILQVANGEGQEIMEVPVNSTGQATYCQDPAIFLKLNGIANDNNYAINVLDTLDLSTFNQKIDVPAVSSNDYGGNFITGPESSPANPLGSIFCFSGVSRPLQEAIGTWCMQNLVQLECGFRNGGERHIDECMCFMPYGPRLFKIWIYSIRNITLSEGVQQMLIQCTDEEKLEIERKLNSFAERPDNVVPIQQIRAGNLDGIPPRIKNRLSGRELECIKEIYKPDPRIPYVRDLGAIRANLERERQANIELVSNSIFARPYAETFGNFVFFPLDLEIDFYLDSPINFKITNVPIFNRVWYETETNVKVLFSIGEAIDPEVERILVAERPHIKSMVNPAKLINYYQINTTQYNEDGRVGGNLHCLIKSVL
jgi:hypothetical protein